MKSISEHDYRVQMLVSDSGEQHTNGSVPWTIDASGLRWYDDERGEQVPIPDEQATACHEFLARCRPAKRGAVGSYPLKHAIGRSAGHYIGEGAVISAALSLGLPVTAAHQGHSLVTGEFWRPRPTSAWIGVTRSSVRRAAQGQGAAR